MCLGYGKDHIINNIKCKIKDFQHSDARISKFLLDELECITS